MVHNYLYYVALVVAICWFVWMDIVGGFSWTRSESKGASSNEYRQLFDALAQLFSQGLVKVSSGSPDSLYMSSLTDR